MLGTLRRRLWGALLVVLPATALAAGPAAPAPQSPAAWLEQMQQAARTVNYHGVFVYLREGAPQTVRIEHRVDTEGESQVLEVLNGPPRRIIREDRRVTLVDPEGDALMRMDPAHGAPLFPGLVLDTEQVGRHYQLKLAARDRVAGRSAQTLLLIPRDGLRYGHRLWLDEASGLALRAELVDRGGDVLEQMLFTHIEVGERVAPARSPDPVAQVDADGAFALSTLPAGFRTVAHSDGAGGAGEHLLVSDGLALVSVYVEALDQDQEPLAGHTGMGAVSVFARVLEDYQVVAVGEVPPATVEQIAAGLVPRGRQP